MKWTTGLGLFFYREMIETMDNHEDAKKIAIILNATARLVSLTILLADWFARKNLRRQ